jgi:hypothetical protein
VIEFRLWQMSTVLKLQGHENIMKVLHAGDSVSFVGTDGCVRVWMRSRFMGRAAVLPPRRMS